MAATNTKNPTDPVPILKGTLLVMIKGRRKGERKEPPGGFALKTFLQRAKVWQKAAHPNIPTPKKCWHGEV